jgi:hypothetical protein
MPSIRSSSINRALEELSNNFNNQGLPASLTSEPETCINQGLDRFYLDIKSIKAFNFESGVNIIRNDIEADLVYCVDSSQLTTGFDQVAYFELIYNEKLSNDQFEFFCGRRTNTPILLKDLEWVPETKYFPNGQIISFIRRKIQFSVFYADLSQDYATEEFHTFYDVGVNFQSNDIDLKIEEVREEFKKIPGSELFCSQNYYQDPERNFIMNQYINHKYNGRLS